MDPEGGQGLVCTVQPVGGEREREREHADKSRVALPIAKVSFLFADCFLANEFM
jgi:hypothetical protein